VNRKGHAWVTSDGREALSYIGPFLDIIDTEVKRRLPFVKHLVVDQDILRVALPLSEKNKSTGFTIMPRGSSMQVEANILRFFIYWKQTRRRTDYDLSAIILDENFQSAGQVSWTNLTMMGGTHSGDLTDATDGATEFIDLDLRTIGKHVSGKYIVPTINIYSGESFTEVQECFFGFMNRTKEQQGKPFEPATVRMKSDIRGDGRIALPLIFMRDDEGSWSAKWLHLYLKGQPRYNRIETNHLSTSLLTKSIVEHNYLSVGYLVQALIHNTETVTIYTPGASISDAATFIGVNTPDNLPEGTTIYTLGNLNQLIPA
jgi:stress response protein SCP2